MLSQLIVFSFSFSSPLRSFDLQRPSIGSEYYGKVSFPFLGHQEITLKITTKIKANINLKGFINYDDDIMYLIDRKGKFDFTFSNELETKLNKYFCKVTNAMYKNNVATITIKIRPLHFYKNVNLYRINCERSFLNSEH
tara:strand:+ start:245 stop:661 length:417 start_codon:yes stop_codon:yes gene_type:complete